MKAETPVLSLSCTDYCDNQWGRWICKTWIYDNFSNVPNFISVELSDKYVRGAISVWFTLCEHDMNMTIYWHETSKKEYNDSNLMWASLEYLILSTFQLKQETTKKLWVTLWEHYDD